MMNKIEHRQFLIRRLKNCKNKLQLRDILKDINEYLEKYNISRGSFEYDNLKNIYDLIKTKLSSDRNFQAENVIKLTESDLLRIIEQVINVRNSD